MQQFPQAEFSVTWLPFQLNASMPKEGQLKLEMYQKKFGSERVAVMLPQMKETGLKEGIQFSYGGMIGNTYDSHRLISLALKQGKQDAVVEELFKNYFEQEKLISDVNVLSAAADKAGVVNAREMLAGNGESDQVDADFRQYARVGGVPYFIINDEVKISGAADASEFAAAFQSL